MKLEQPIAEYNGTPQVEDGYTKIANELLEAIVLFKFTERQYKVLFCIIRKTYGFNKTHDDISLSQLSKLCNLPINHVSAVLNQLVKLNVIIKSQGKYSQNLRINKLYDNWGLHNMECHNMELLNVDKGVTSLGLSPCHNMAIQKKTPKDNTKDKIFIPDFIDKELWSDFKKMRVKIKKPMTDRAEKLMINKLKKMHDAGMDIKQSIENSIINNWQDIYEPKDSKENKQPEWKRGLL